MKSSGRYNGLGYLSALKELGWTRAELARRLKIHPNSVSKWGETAPGYALAYLDLAVSVKRIADGLKRAA